MLSRIFLVGPHKFTISIRYLIFCCIILAGTCVNAAPLKQSVIVKGKPFVVEIPNGLCEGSLSDWGVKYKQFLFDLGIASKGKPEILSVIANCEFLFAQSKSILPTTWGYLAFDGSIGRYWFGQSSLNNRLIKEIESLESKHPSGLYLKDITNNSLKKLKSDLSIGEVVRLGRPTVNEQGFMMTALARFKTKAEVMDVYLTTVTFIRNRQILTFTVYERASREENLEHVRLIGQQFLKSLRNN